MVALFNDCVVWLLSSHEGTHELLEFDAYEELDDEDEADSITE